MDEKASPPQTTKELLIQHSVRRLASRYRQEFASGLLSGRTALPARWLKPRQIDFVELELDSTVDDTIHAAAIELTDRIVQLTELVYALLHDFCRQHETVLDQRQRANLRRGSGPSLVCKVLYRRYATWPPADPRKLRGRVRTEIDKALSGAIPRHRDRSSAAGTAPVAPSWPADDRALAVWDRTRATDDPDKLRRYVLLYLVEAFVRTVPGLLAVVTLAVVYLGLFLALRHFTPELTTREHMIVAGTAITAALGGSGAMLAGQAIRARLDQEGRAAPRAGRRRRTDDAE